MENDCFTDDYGYWRQNEDCSRWFNTGNAFKAYKADVNETYVAFQLAYEVHFQAPGSVEFKYRKDSLESYGRATGNFRFQFSNEIIMSDTNLTNSDWQTYRYENITPGVHILVWLYIKY